jgi:PAS domain S-box-containing protein
VAAEARKSCFIGGQLTLSLFLLAVVLPSAAAQVKPVRRALILNELGPGSPAINLIDGEIRARLERSPYQIELYTESLETTLFPDPATQKEFFDSYIRKYRDRKPDVIIAVGPSPVHFMVQSHEKFFTDTPVVFCVTTPGMVGNPTLDPSFTGVWEMPDFTKTLEVALKLLPSTRHIVVVGGVSPYDRANEAIIKDGLRGYETRFDVTYLTDLDMPTLLERLMRLPENSIILQAGISEDAVGTRYIIATQSNPMVAQAANAPVFPAGDMADADVGRGAIGGYLTSFAKEGEIAAEDAERILNGDKAKDIPIVRGANAYIFDLRALKRWGLKETNLPPGSTVLNRQPSLWVSFRWYVIGGMTLILAEALLISGLLWQRTRRKAAETKLTVAYKQLEADIADRKRAEATLHESEERFRLVANTAPVMIWMSGPDKLWTYFNPFWLKFTGRSLEAEIGNGWTEGVHSEDLERYMDVYTTAFDRREPFQTQFRLRRRDGEYRWIFQRGVPRFEMDGSFAGYIGACSDITERKLAEEALATMSRKLLEAQEQERKRIARELHDNTNQRLALLAVEIEQLKNAIPDQIPDVRVRMGEIHKQTLEISNDIQDLSHELHSSKLEYFGLVLAVKSFCREFSGKHKVEVAFASEGMPAVIPPEISLCLFRVMQEGLHNALKHSGVKLFDVKLLGSPTEIRLTVRDLGKGFDPELAKDTPGLGLVSMQERVRHVKGTISITSRPQSGTEINVRVPLSAETPAEQTRAAGA